MRMDSMNSKIPDIRQFRIFESQGWIIYSHPSYPEALARYARMSTPEGHGPPGFAAVKASAFARVHTGQVTLQGFTYKIFVKQYLYRSLSDRIKHIVRPSRALRSLKASMLLSARGFLCPTIVGVGLLRPWRSKIPIIRHLPFCRISSSVTLAIPDAVPLHTYFWAQTRLSRKWAFLQALGHEIGRLHQEGFFHGDLRTGNIMVQERGSDWRFWFLDNERTRHVGSLSEAMLARNLMQLHLFIDRLTHTDRMRFLKAYQEHVNMSRAQQRSLVAGVMAKTRDRVAKKRAVQVLDRTTRAGHNAC